MMKSPTEDIAATKRREIKAADLFCGAGGESQGIVDACREAGYSVQITAINHWPVAIATHKKNHPTAISRCANLDNVNPRDFFKEGELKLLTASPECTFHSVARGGKPIKDQSRATAFCVQRWVDACLPDHVIIENVPEFRNWGPLMRKRIQYKYKPTFEQWLRKHRGGKKSAWRKVKHVMRSKLDWVPDPKHKGETFMAWIGQLESFGYRVDYRVIVCADFGDPTTRERLFIQGVRIASRKKIVWPEPTHAPEASTDMFGHKREAWFSARDHVIDWSHKGVSIFDRKRSLVRNTIRRIIIGWLRFGIEPFILPQQHYDDRVRSTKDPLQTVTTESRGIGLAEANLVKLQGTSTVSDVDKPLPAVTAGGNHLGLAESSLIEVNHGVEKGKSVAHRAKDTKKPLPTVTGSRGIGVAEYLIQTDQTGGNGSYSTAIDKPLGTIVTKANKAVIETGIKPVDGDYMVVMKGTSDAVDSRKPAPAVTCKQHLAVAETKLTQVKGGSFTIGTGGPEGSAKPASTQKPLKTILCANRTAVCETEFILPDEGVHRGNAPRSPDKPLQTVTAEHGAGKLVETMLEAVTGAFTLGQQSGAQPRSVEEPIATIATAGAVSLCTPYLIKFYGAADAQPIDIPLGTVTTKDRFALVEVLLERVMDCALRRTRPVISINGVRFYLEILFRMLKWPELAKAMSFPDGYMFTGKDHEIVKQIGNAVPRKTAKALVRAALTQNSCVA